MVTWLVLASVVALVVVSPVVVARAEGTPSATVAQTAGAEGMTAMGKWTQPAILSGCSGTGAPHVVFPSDSPTHGTGPGAIVWSASPRCPSGAGVLVATISPADDDVPGQPALPRTATGQTIALRGAVAATPGPYGRIVIAGASAGEGATPAGELLLRYRTDTNQADLTRLLAEWEHWSAEVLESHLSYPVLAYFRSQHSNQSWLAALTTILDTSALVMIGFDGWCMRQAELTFAMARHAMVDLAQVFSAPQYQLPAERLPDEAFAALIAQLKQNGMTFRDLGGQHRLAELRAMYEPYAAALSHYFALPLPAWVREGEHLDNWQAAPWKTRVADRDSPDHF